VVEHPLRRLGVGSEVQLRLLPDRPDVPLWYTRAGASRVYHSACM
jgi:hypothetical protein